MNGWTDRFPYIRTWRCHLMVLENLEKARADMDELDPTFARQIEEVRDRFDDIIGVYGQIVLNSDTYLSGMNVEHLERIDLPEQTEVNMQRIADIKSYCEMIGWTIDALMGACRPKPKFSLSRYIRRKLRVSKGPSM